MSDIELVIKMPEEKYREIINFYQGSKVRPKDYEIAIINGTPLPKGHGELIDKDALIGKIHGVKSIVAVLDADTIVEADKESNKMLDKEDTDIEKER